MPVEHDEPVAPLWVSNRTVLLWRARWQLGATVAILAVAGVAIGAAFLAGPAGVHASSAYRDLHDLLGWDAVGAVWLSFGVAALILLAVSAERLPTLLVLYATWQLLNAVLFLWAAVTSDGGGAVGAVAFGALAGCTLVVGPAVAGAT